MGGNQGRALRDLRRARRRRHFSRVDFWEALYRVYVTALFGSLGVAIVSGYLGGGQVAPATLERVVDHGAAALGVAIAAAVGLGIRSGARGGPVALHPADVHVVLLAPVSRRRALLDPALRQLRFAVFVGAVLGAVAGNLASRRLPGGWTAWVVSGVGQEPRPPWPQWVPPSWSQDSGAGAGRRWPRWPWWDGRCPSWRPGPRPAPPRFWGKLPSSRSTDG